MSIDDFMDRLADRFGSVGEVAFIVLCVLCVFITAMTFVYLVAVVSPLFSALPFIAVAWMIRVVMK